MLSPKSDFVRPYFLAQFSEPFMSTEFFEN